MDAAASPIARTDSGLNLENFTQIGVRGVLDPWNGYCHSMAWFQDKLFIGTLRAPMCILCRKGRALPAPPMEFWPVKCPDPEDPEIMRAQILCYDTDSKNWRLVHRSPLVEKDGQTLAREISYRGMVVYQSQRDRVPALYVGSISTWGCQILRTEDGVHFHDPEGVLGGTSTRTVCPFKGKLYTSVVGIAGRDANESLKTEVIETDDPSSGKWTAVSVPGFGDPANVSVFDIAEFNGHLYATTMNPTSGFQLWKTDGEGPPPFRWKKVITAGAYRGFLNEYGLALCAFGDSLYCGTGIAGGGYDRFNKVGPAAAELIRIHADDTWDLLVGTPRLTPEGMKIPLSGMGPGFDNFMNGYLWRMCVHDGWLYMGTFNWAAFLPFRPHSLQKVDPETRRFYARLLPTGSVEGFMEKYGGCHLWRTQDGQRFYPITRNGFGSAYNAGIRRFVSTPKGLFLGTVNQFGPTVGVNRDGQWRYEENPRGGIEIWQGVANQAAPIPPAHESAIELRRGRQVRHSLVKANRRSDYLNRVVMLDSLYGESGFHHVGYWDGKTATVAEAGARMVEFAMERLGGAKGPALEIECGRGGTTKHLERWFPSGALTATDEAQLTVDFAHLRATASHCKAMDATHLEFPDESFSTLFCFEGATSLETRFRFLREAHRVLKPGGKLLLTDVLFSKEAVLANRGLYRANYVRDIAAYRQLLVRAGFGESVVEDLRAQTLTPFIEKTSATLRELYGAGGINEGTFSGAMAYISRYVLFARSYVLAIATKKS